MPNEVVRAIDKKGTWAEVEHTTGCTGSTHGWVLKKYLERVPANFSKSS